MPAVSLWDGRVVGVEVLARWHTPDGRVLLPAEFLPLVADAGLWVDLDEAVLVAALHASIMRTFGFCVGAWSCGS
jgi:EAL domain-containing protein (putative c-di-GMP-specific phosphodiesterase class I)